TSASWIAQLPWRRLASMTEGGQSASNGGRAGACDHADGGSVGEPIRVQKERWQRGVQCIAWGCRDGEAGDPDPAGGANGGAGVNGIQSQPTNQRLPEASSDGRAEQPGQAGDDQLVAESEHRPQGSINSHGAGDP